MQSTTAREIRRFRRRLHAALFWGGFSSSLVAVSLALGIGLLVGRLWGIWPTASPWWLAGLILPVGYGVWRARTAGIGTGDSLAHLDRRLGLGGLLISAAEREPGAWQGVLEQGLADARARLPGFRWRRLATGPALALLALLAVISLDPPPSNPFVSNPPMEEQLADLQQELELILEEGVVEEARGEELSTRLQELRERIEDGEAVEWSDVDGLSEALSRELAEQNVRLEEALAQLSAFASGQGAGDAPGESAAAFAEMMQNARAAGLFADLPPELAEQLGAAMGANGAVDPLSMPTSPEDLQRLAQALAEAAGDQLGDLALQGLVDPAELGDLQDVLAQHGLMVEPGHEHGAECAGGNCPGGTIPGQLPGRGGITRGPGPASLDYTNQTEGDTSAFDARRLPPGRSPSEEWQLVGLSRARPDADPTRATGAGGQGEAGSGAASWRRRMAPRHREVVRRFFTAVEKK